MLNLIGLTFYTLYIGAIIGGALLLVSMRGWRRLVGVMLIAEGLFACGLLTLMSSKYWFGDRDINAPFINIGVKYIVITTISTLVPLAVAGTIIIVLGRWIARSIQGQHWLLTLLVPLLLLPLGMAGGTAGLIQLSKPETPV